MKRWLMYAAALAAAALCGFHSTDVGKLEPVQVLRVGYRGEQVLIETDGGDTGRGKTVARAVEDLMETASGEIFLETVEDLLLLPGAEELLPALGEYLRPGCGVCLEAGNGDLEQAGEYLSAHKLPVSLLDYRAGNHSLPRLEAGEEGMRIVP